MADKTSRKRKSQSTPNSHPIKKPRHTLDSYFSAPVAIVSKNSDDLSGGSTVSRVALSAEQTRVLRMVLDEGRNVFFTGAAGKSNFMLATQKQVLTPDRNWEVSPAARYYQRSEEKVCRTT